jgi:hypothetical protein
LRNDAHDHLPISNKERRQMLDVAGNALNEQFQVKPYAIMKGFFDRQ